MQRSSRMTTHGWGRGLRLSAGLAAVAMAATACSFGERTAPEGEEGVANAASSGDVLSIVLPEEPPTLEPCDANLAATGRVTRSNITEALTFRDPDGTTLQPMLAEEWERLDELTWEFTLREGVTFHDGSAFDADVVVAAYQRMLDPAVECNVLGYVFGDSELTVEAPDATTVRITTGSPDPILPLRASFVEIPGPDTPADAKIPEPVGTGPFELTQWDAGERIRLTRFEGYWGDAPEIEQVEYQWRGEDTIRASMVQNGEADIAHSLPPQNASDPQAVTFSNAETSYLRLDPRIAPLDDLRVREAVAHAIDREGIVEGIFEGLGEPATQVIPDSVVGFNPGLEGYEYDPEAARALLDEARADGVDVDQPITILGRTGIYPKATEAMEAVQAMLQDVGLTVELEMMDVSAWLEYLLRPFPEDVGPNMLQAQHGNQAGDAVFTMEQIYGGEGSQSTGGSDELDAVIAEASAAEGEERVELFNEALRLAHELVRDVPIAHMEGIMMVSDRVDFVPDGQTNDRILLSSISWR